MSVKANGQLTPLGHKSIDFFSEEGCRALVKQIHNSLSNIQGKQVKNVQIF